MVKTNAPGAFSCEIYLKAWLMGERRPGCYVMEHIDNCWFCRDLVHGGTREFPLSIEAEARGNLARHDRRNFFRYVAATIGGLSLAGLGAGSLWVGAPDNAETARSKAMSQLDRRFLVRGPSFVTKSLQQGSIEDKQSVMWWVVERKHSQFYGDIVERTADAVAEVKSAAIGLLLDIPPVDLRVHANRIDSIKTAETDPVMRDMLQFVLDLIAGA